MTGFRSAPPRGVAAEWAAADGRRTDPATARAGGLRMPGGRRRSAPHLLAGALLVVACAVGFAVIAGRVDHRGSVLALARPVSVGHQLSAADLRVVRVSADSGVASIPASQQADVVGQPAAVSLPAGALLTRAELGPPGLPAGMAVVALAVKPGQAPPELAAGEYVLLVPSTTSAPAGAGGSTTSAVSPGGPWSGVVTAVAAPTGVSDSTVVSVQLPAAQARVVAALTPGQVDLVLVSGS